MNRILLASALGVAAIAVAAAPAVAGLVGNPSFSHEVPVQVPSQARIAHLVDDHGRDGAPHASPSSTTAPSSEPGDDRGGHAEPGDDRGRGTEPGDDRSQTSGANRGLPGPGEPEPGDDDGGLSPRTPEPGDDRGGGSGDGGGSGH
jgi:hypothetical protein